MMETPKSSRNLDDQPLANYIRMQEEGLKPNIGVILAALKVCKNSRDLKSGRRIHSDALATGLLHSNIYFANILIDMYAKCGAIVDARSVFESLKLRDVVSWTAIIQGFVHNKDFPSALELYARMLRDDETVPDRLTLLAALKACVGSIGSLSVDKVDKVNGKVGKAEKVERVSVNLEWLNRGKEIHHQAARTGDESDDYVSSTLVDLYSKCGSLSTALHVFGCMQRLHVVSWTSMILGCVNTGEARLALEMFSQMQEDGGCQPDSVALVAALKACAHLAEREQSKETNIYLEKGRAIHQLLLRPVNLELTVANTLVDMYSKCGSLVEARGVFESIKRRSVVSWNCMILGYVNGDESRLALELYSRMQREGCSPDRITVIAALKACCTLGSLDTGRLIQGQIFLSGLQTDLTVMNSLVDFYGKCGSMPEAEQVFSMIRNKNVVSWSSLISGYTTQGDPEQVFNLFKRMQEGEERVQPDEVTYLCLLTTCSRSGLVAKAREYFREMKSKHGIAPSRKHYTCMVNLLGRTNHLEEAVKMVETMPLEPDLVIWMVLLECSKKWRNVRVGEVAFQSVIRVDDKNSTAYVLMSNIYAECGFKEESLKIQSKMKK